MSKRAKLVVIAVVVLVLTVSAWAGSGALWHWLLAMHGVR